MTTVAVILVAWLAAQLPVGIAVGKLLQRRA
jgi:hypothetical protein